MKGSGLHYVSLICRRKRTDDQRLAKRTGVYGETML
jgi:hypothetical protein